MTEAPKRRRLRRPLLIAAAGALTAGGVAVALGPAAPWFVDHLADGRRAGRLGYLEIDGVSGSWLGNLRAEHVRIRDDDGVWIDIEDVALDWRPQVIAFGALRIDAARAARVSVLRQPKLLERRPTSGASIDFRIAALDIDTIDIAEPVVGQAAIFTASLSLDWRDRRLEGLDLELRRTDSAADRVLATYEPDDAFVLDVDIEGAPGGILSRLAGAPDSAVRAVAAGHGDDRTGGADFSAAIGDDELLAGEAGWTPTGWTLDARGRLDVLSPTAALARRIGPTLAVQGGGARAGAFELHAATPFLAVELKGELDEDHELAGAARFTATTQRLSDIARESPFELGAARLVGQLRRGRGATAFQATLMADEIDALGQRTSLRGPIRATLTRDRFVLAGDLRAPDDAPALFDQARLHVELGYDRRRGRFALDKAELRGDAVDIDAQGWATRGDGEFSGAWRVRRLKAVSQDLRGQIGGAWRAYAEDNNGARVWTTTITGAGSGVQGDPVIVPQLLGPTPRFDALLRNERGGVTVSHARLDGAQLRAAAMGRIVRGDADLALEASARGPLTLGGAEIAGAVDATGRLTGRIARPTLTANATLSSFAAGGVIVEQPRVEFTLAPAAQGYAGRAHVLGTTSGQPVNATSLVAIDRGGLALTEIDSTLGALAAQGSASFSAQGASADLAISGRLDGLAPGVSGAIAGDLTLTPAQLQLNAQITNARAGELRVRAATLTAQGSMSAIAAEFELRGRLRDAPLAFAGTGTIDVSGDSTLTLEGRGVLADAEVFTRAPIRAAWRGDRLDASLNVALGDGVVTVDWTERGRTLSGTARIEDAPLAPLAAIWGERAEGRIDGRIQMANAGGGLSGEADVALDDARFAGRQRGTLDMRIAGDLDPGRLRAIVDATSTDGLVAHFEADAPVTTSAAPIRIALTPERRGRATWAVRGPAASLWAAARLQDQNLEGQLDGEGELSFGAGHLSGAGHIEIVDGVFEDKLTGVRLVDLDARVAIDERGVNIENLTAAGPRGGRLTATGGSANQRAGEIVVNIRDMLVADRPDARARANGDLTLRWEGLHSRLSGEINIIEADIDVAANPEAGIPTLDVIEINRPGEEDEETPPEDAPSRRNGSTVLDVAVNADGRVFTRGRGVDAEWSLDMRLRGTSRNPLVFGQARAVRGTLALSGQPFEIEDARIVFDGDPLDARIDLSAVRDTADLSARIRLTGTARDPEVSFSSDPALPEDEILPQVLFGRSVEDLSALEAAQLAASLAALSGRASLDLVDAARAAAGLDRFNVRQDEDGGFLVAGGVYLTRDVYVEVARTGLGQAQTRVEWTVRPRLVLITSFLGNGDQRVSLRWRRESD